MNEFDKELNQEEFRKDIKQLPGSPLAKEDSKRGRSLYSWKRT